MHPHTAYGLSKRDQDEIAITLGRRYRIPSIALRYSIVQGPRQSFRTAYSGALRAFAVCVLHREAPVLFEDGKQLGDYLSIHEVVRANLPLETPGMLGRSLNVGGDRRVAVAELARLVVECAGADTSPLIPNLFRVRGTRHVFSDVSALKAFGWRVDVPQPGVVAEYLEWASSQPDLRNTYAEAERRMRALGVIRRAGLGSSGPTAQWSGRPRVSP